jgi:hypothetical protein
VCIRQYLATGCGQSEHVIQLPLSQQSAIRGDRRAAEPEHQTTVEIEPQRLATPLHPSGSPSVSRSIPHKILNSSPESSRACFGIAALSEECGIKSLLRARALDDPETRGRIRALTIFVQTTRGDAETKIFLRGNALDDANVEVRRASLGLIVALFGHEDETKTLLRERALNDPDTLNSAALHALGRYFGDDPEIKALLLARARDDPNEDFRAAAFLALSRLVRGEEPSILASKQLDGWLPGRDPREPISGDVIARAASSLGESKESIRFLFERLAEELEVPLTFA